jgi:hypothetical protein
MIIRFLLSVDPKIRRVKMLVACVPFRQNKIMSVLAVFYFRQRGDLAKRFSVFPGRRPYKTHGLFLQTENRLFNVIHAKRHGIRLLVSEMRNPLQSGLFMRVFDQNRRAASSSKNLHAMPFVLKDFGGGISFIPHLKEFVCSFLQVNGPENEMVQDGTEADPHKRQAARDDPGYGILQGKIRGILLQDLFRKGGILTAGGK